MSTNHERTDFLVIGSGIAGLSVALELAELGEVTVLSKRDPHESSTDRAQGGIATVLDPVEGGDTFEAHIADTLRAGAGLCHPDIVRLCVEEGPARVRFLEAQGVPFTRDPQGGGYHLGREGGHSQRRVLHVDDMTGRAVVAMLLSGVQKNPRIRLLPWHVSVDLILAGKLQRRFGQVPERCVGAYVMDTRADRIVPFVAHHTVLASGGSGKAYLYTSNPDIATGDGVAMAYRAGARIKNMEFFQFHPTCLYHPQAGSFLVSEALRGEGGVLRLRSGEPFMRRYHDMADLAPRDVVARSIDQEMKRTGDDHVFLDMTGLDPLFLVDRFPNIHERCLRLGIDMRTQPIPVVPAAHYQCGGVETDAWGRTNVAGLYAAGEVACTGLHGANRLASNSLLEALVFAHRVAEYCRRVGPPPETPAAHDIPDWNLGYARMSDEAVSISQAWDEIRRLMWNLVGIVRSNMRLERARRRMDLILAEVSQDYWRYAPTPDLLELRSIATVARLIVDSAWSRNESRGLHYTLDYPEQDDSLGSHDTILWRGIR